MQAWLTYLVSEDPRKEKVSCSTKILRNYKSVYTR